MALNPPSLPLLSWPEVDEAVQLRAERDRLIAELKPRGWRPYAQRRRDLEARLREVTTRLIEVETKLEAGAARHGLRL